MHITNDRSTHAHFKYMVVLRGHSYAFFVIICDVRQIDHIIYSTKKYFYDVLWKDNISFVGYPIGIPHKITNVFSMK